MNNKINIIFLSGLIPRLLFEASTVTCVNGIAYLLRTYVFNEDDMGRLIDFFSSVIIFCLIIKKSVNLIIFQL